MGKSKKGNRENVVDIPGLNLIEELNILNNQLTECRSEIKALREKNNDRRQKFENLVNGKFDKLLDQTKITPSLTDDSQIEGLKSMLDEKVLIIRLYKMLLGGMDIQPLTQNSFKVSLENESNHLEFTIENENNSINYQPGLIDFDVSQDKYYLKEPIDFQPDYLPLFTKNIIECLFSLEDAASEYEESEEGEEED